MNIDANTPTDTSIAEHLTGYIKVPNEYWHLIPVQTHVRYFVKGDEPRNERYRSGGFVKYNHLAYTENPGLGLIMTVSRDSFRVNADDIAEIHKKVDPKIFVEMLTIMNYVEQRINTIQQ